VQCAIRRDSPIGAGISCTIPNFELLSDEGVDDVLVALRENQSRKGAVIPLNRLDLVDIERSY